MTYVEEIQAAREAAENGDYALSNFHLFIAAGYARGDELETIRELIAMNDDAKASAAHAA